jgi:hypothetical protein
MKFGDFRAKQPGAIVDMTLKCEDNL